MSKSSCFCPFTLSLIREYNFNALRLTRVNIKFVFADCLVNRHCRKRHSICVEGECTCREGLVLGKTSCEFGENIYTFYYVLGPVKIVSLAWYIKLKPRVIRNIQRRVKMYSDFTH